MQSEERRILLVANFGHFMCHYNLLVFPALVLPLAGILKMDLAQVLQLSFLQYLLFGVSALPWGIAADRWGGRSLMLLMFLGAGISGFAAAFWIEDPEKLWLSLGCLGLFSGIGHPIGMGLISKGVKRLNVAMGYNAMFGGLGLVVAPAATGIVNWAWGPRAAYFLVGTINLVGMALPALLPLAKPQHKEKIPMENGNGLLGAFIILLVATMLAGISYTGSSVILPAYIELKSQALLQAVSAALNRDISGNLFATSVAAVIYMVGMLGQYIGGHAGERFDVRYTYLVFHLFCLPAALLMAFTQNLPLATFGGVYFFFLLGSQATENTLVAALAPKRLHHSAFGMKFILTFGVGALAVKILGWVDTMWGSEATFLALGINSALLVGTIAFLILRTNRSVIMPSRGGRLGYSASGIQPVMIDRQAAP
ncbi:MAG: MFS transporter [Desulfomonilaceae bacterium]